MDQAHPEPPMPQASNTRFSEGAIARDDHHLRDGARRVGAPPVAGSPRRTSSRWSLHGALQVPLRVCWLTLGAMLLYGALAAWVNRSHGEVPMLRSALVQGLSCGVTTASLSTLIDRGIARLLLRRRSRRGSAALTALGAMALGTGLHVAVNWWSGTPELIATVAWPAAALALYCPLYAAAALRRWP